MVNFLNRLFNKFLKAGTIKTFFFLMFFLLIDIGNSINKTIFYKDISVVNKGYIIRQISQYTLKDILIYLTITYILYVIYFYFIDIDITYNKICNMILFGTIPSIFGLISSLMWVFVYKWKSFTIIHFFKYSALSGEQAMKFHVVNSIDGMISIISVVFMICFLLICIFKITILDDSNVDF